MVHDVIVVYAVPIPVGHRVTVRWYAQDKAGFFGKRKAKEFQPVVIDHDTGIEWTSDFAHDGGVGIKGPDQPIAIADAPAAGLAVERELTGKVVRCRVVHVRGFAEIDVQTHFAIEAQPG